MRKHDKCPACGAPGMVYYKADFTGALWDGDPITFPDAEWGECPACDEYLLSQELSDRMEAEAEKVRSRA
jgi:hypothetical protein